MGHIAPLSKFKINLIIDHFKRTNYQNFVSRHDFGFLRLDQHFKNISYVSSLTLGSYNSRCGLGSSAIYIEQRER